MSRVVVRVAAALALALTELALAAPRAHASAPSYADGGFVTITGERAIVVWDAAKATEHLVLELTFVGDAKDFGVLVPTPPSARVGKVDEPPFDGLALMATSAGPRPDSVRPAPPALELERLYAFDVVALRDVAALTAWQTKRGHALRDNTTTWARAYFARGWVLQAIGFASARAGAGAHPLRTPGIRFSFPVDAPYFPYAEPSSDAKDESDFARRAGPRDDERALDIVTVAPTPLHAIGGRAGGLAMAGGGATNTADVARALSDASAWSFEPASRGDWTLTHFVDRGVRVAPSDFTFAAGWPASIAAQQSSTHAPRAHGASAGVGARRTKRTLVALFVFVFVLVFAALAALLERDRRRDSTR